MTARACFTGKIAAGVVDKDAGAAILEHLDALEADYVAQAGKAAAARAAAQEAQTAAAHMAWREEQKALNAIKAQVTVLRAVNAYGSTVDKLRGEGKAPVALAQLGDRLGGFASWLSLNGESPLGAAVRSLYTKDLHDIATWGNVEFTAREVRGLFYAKIDAALEAMRPTMLGLKEQLATQIEIVRALHGEPNVSPQARAAAEALGKGMAWLREAYNEAGGWIPERKNWRLPNPTIDPVKVRSVTAEEFVRRTLPRLDRDGMISFATGLRLSDQQLDDLLRKVHGTMASEGRDGVMSTAVAGRGALSEARDLPRVLVFKNADGWLGHLDDFGRGSAWDAIVGHARSMADEIAQLRVLGNPDAAHRAILSLFDREANRLAAVADATADPAAKQAVLAHNRRLATEVRGDRARFVALDANVTGIGRDPTGNLVVAAGLGAQRDMLRASALGSAVISSFGDAGTMLMAARFNGLPVMDVLSRFSANLAKGDGEVTLRQLGVVVDQAARSVHAADRFLGEEIGVARTAKISNAVMKASLLERWTDAGRAAFGAEMAAQLANRAAMSFDDANRAFRGGLERYGITASDWAALKAAPRLEPTPGAQFVSPAVLAEAGHGDLASKISRMLHQEIDHAVVENIDPTIRALTLGTSSPGTTGGEVRRAVGTFKGTPTQIVMQMMFRSLARGWDGTRLSYGAASFVAMSALGMLAMQTKEVAKGRDPLSLDPTTAIGRAAIFKGIIQGGGLGVFGDMVAQDKTRMGNSWATMLAGPQFSQAESVLGQWLLANVRRGLNGEATHFMGDALYVGAKSEESSPAGEGDA